MGISVSVPSENCMQNKNLFYRTNQVRQSIQKHDERESMEKQIVNNPNWCSKENVTVQNTPNSASTAAKEKNIKREEIPKSLKISIQKREEEIENEKPRYNFQRDETSLCSTPRVKVNFKLTPLRS